MHYAAKGETQQITTLGYLFSVRMLLSALLALLEGRSAQNSAELQKRAIMGSLFFTIPKDADQKAQSLW
jgi:hypothetical protein